MDKVYCKNCANDYGICGCHRFLKRNPFTGVDEGHQRDRNINKQGDCEFYKKTLFARYVKPGCWKFWTNQ